MNNILELTQDSWKEEEIQFISIIDFPFKQEGIFLKDFLNHGFDDIKSFFPSWEVFLNRAKGFNSNYPNYMVYLLCKTCLSKKKEHQTKKRKDIIGVLAVQLLTYNLLKEKNHAVIPKFNLYLYLSWIALDKQYRSYNYFSLLFEYYHIIIRRFREEFNMDIQGAAIIIRRMREVIWSLFNEDTYCPSEINKIIIKDSPRFKFHILPIEIFNGAVDLKEDHLLIHFKQRNL